MIAFDALLRTVLGAKTAKVMSEKLGLHTVGDLLRHYPRRYAKQNTPTDFSTLVEGEHVSVVATIQRVERLRNKNGPGSRLQVIVGDGKNLLSLVFFNPKNWFEQQFVQGRSGLFAGQVTVFNRNRQLAHPQFLLMDSEEGRAELEQIAGGLIPIYPATKELTSWAIAKSVRTVLDLVTEAPDPLPMPLRTRHQLMDLATALRGIHRPADWGALEASKARLTWDEAFALQVTLAQRRVQAASRTTTARPARSDGLLAALDAALPFELTDGQRDIGAVLADELAQKHPMHRLLQGEVGSGKTMVALRAMLQVVDAGGQAALLAPTEVLASQHARSLRELLGPMARAGELDGAEKATRVTLLTGSLSAPARRTALHEASTGAAGIVVGTHALLSEGVEFADLGLVVVDEQHRFGVEQRDALRAKGSQPPHVLVMTATPIPRTVAMTVFGDLEVSELAQLPAGRSPITSSVVPAAEKPAWLDRAWQRVREEVEKGHQAYVVCPRIGDGVADDDAEDTAEISTEDSRRPPLAVMDIAPQVEKGALQGLRLAVLHGRLPSDEKDAVMRDFAAGKIDVLVATTVIEVGVNVPNATVMVILDADRFGVSQLHQLRGRVGRGSAAGLCLLVSESWGGSPARERLDAVAATTDGFELARVDLEQRREGDVLGAAQSGRRSQLKLLSLLRDADLIAEARAEAMALVAADPDLTEHPVLAAAVGNLVDADRAEYLEKG